MALFPELRDLESLQKRLQRFARIEQLAELRHGENSFPLLSFSLGSQDPKAPVLGIFGGVHGVERIGSKVALAFLENLAGRVDWDESLQWQLERMRIILMPLVNPVGMHLSWRSNGNHVDLMRNAPVRADNATFLVGGQRFSTMLPWFMGSSEKMEIESQAVCDFVRREAFDSRCSILVDCHSGFGIKDRLWFPYARTQQPFPNLPEVFALKDLLKRAQPNHVYQFEPQAKNYTTHGDLWDYLYDEHRGQGRPGTMIPLTLEMGSWIWVRKNPFQVLSFMGAFNPVKPHRLKRTLRRHLPLFDFLMRAAHSTGPWLGHAPDARTALTDAAHEHWYREDSDSGSASAPPSE